MKSEIERIAKRFISIGANRIDILLTLTLIVFVTILLIESRNYRFQAQLTPIGILSITLILLIVLLVQQIRKEQDLMNPDNLNNSINSGKDSVEYTHGDQDTPHDEKLVESRKLLLRYLSWVLFLPFVAWLIGLFYASILFLLLFLRFEAKQPWKINLLITISIMGFVYILFEYYLPGGLYSGIFDIQVFSIF